MNIGVIGNGFVGKSLHVLKNNHVNIMFYDINPELCNPRGLSLVDMKKCEIIFVSVPTPMRPDGSVHLDIVQSIINQLNNLSYEGFIVIRSTVLPGTCDDLNVYFMPEFLTERNYIADFKANPLWVFGLLGTKDDIFFKEKIIKLLNYAHESKCIESNTIEWMLNKNLKW